jgi:hypothetical protein
MTRSALPDVGAYITVVTFGALPVFEDIAYLPSRTDSEVSSLGLRLCTFAFRRIPVMPCHVLIPGLPLASWASSTRHFLYLKI